MSGISRFRPGSNPLELVLLFVLALLTTGCGAVALEGMAAGGLEGGAVLAEATAVEASAAATEATGSAALRFGTRASIVDTGTIARSFGGSEAVASTRLFSLIRTGELSSILEEAAAPSLRHALRLDHFGQITVAEHQLLTVDQASGAIRISATQRMIGKIIDGRIMQTNAAGLSPLEIGSIRSLSGLSTVYMDHVLEISRVSQGWYEIDLVELRKAPSLSALPLLAATSDRKKKAAVSEAQIASPQKSASLKEDEAINKLRTSLARLKGANAHLANELSDESLSNVK